MLCNIWRLNRSFVRKRKKIGKIWNNGYTCFLHTELGLRNTRLVNYETQHHLLLIYFYSLFFMFIYIYFFSSLLSCKKIYELHLVLFITRNTCAALLLPYNTWLSDILTFTIGYVLVQLKLKSSWCARADSRVGMATIGPWRKSWALYMTIVFLTLVQLFWTGRADGRRWEEWTRTNRVLCKDSPSLILLLPSAHTLAVLYEKYIQRLSEYELHIDF